MEPRAPPLEFKKSQSNPLASCPPLKVRKEKLGERIAALQQLVAPHGKTNTASVLLEAIGYMKFLQDHVEGLRGDDHNELTEAKPKGELRRQGLCLVPLPYMSHIDFANCGGPPVFNLPLVAQCP